MDAMDTLSLKSELRQQLHLTPQMLQSTEILQMNTQELLDYLRGAMEENPVLEPGEAPLEEYHRLQQRLAWLDAGPLYGGGDGPEPGRPDRETESLAAFLRDQLSRLSLERPLLVLCLYMAELVDENGYLEQEDLDGLEALRLGPGLAEQALQTLQGLEPAGVCARDLAECLALQLRRLPDAPPCAAEIAERFLPQLGRKQYGPIARALGLTQEQVRQAAGAIAALDPRPGRAFQSAEPPAYIQPDVFIAEQDGQLQPILNVYCLPHITVSRYYASLVKQSDDPETRAYLRQKLQQAHWLLDCVERRGSTLKRCAGAILDAQRPFFTEESAELTPMTRSDLAEALGLHISTVSRAVRDKYLQCRRGTFPLSYFFSRPVGTEQTARQAVQQRIRALIRQEDPRHPLSDAALCRRLEAEGVTVSRRAVAKYRAGLGLGSSTARKKA